MVIAHSNSEKSARNRLVTKRPVTPPLNWLFRSKFRKIPDLEEFFPNLCQYEEKNLSALAQAVAAIGLNLGNRCYGVERIALRRSRAVRSDALPWR